MAKIDYLIVAGGGGGGNGNGGGGGAGGLIQAFNSPLNSTGTYPIVIGGGGATQTDGTNTTFNSLIAIGGGSGAGWATNGRTGGSGSGGAGNNGASTPTVGLGTSGQGNNGGIGHNLSYWNSGGGGGAGAVGGAALAGLNGGGVGGAGLQSSISGTAKFYSGGGAGSSSSSSSSISPAGGSSIGGNGGYGSGANATGKNAVINTGSGGGAGNDSGQGGSGSSGIVIISYITGTITATGGNITTNGDYTVHTFLTSSNFIVTDLVVIVDGKSFTDFNNKSTTKINLKLDSNVLDTSNTPYTLTPLNLTYVYGRNKQCGSFTYSNPTSIQIPTALRFPSTFTFSFWLKTNSLTPANGANSIITDWGASQRNFLIQQVSNGNIEFNNGGGGSTQDTALTGGKLVAGVWTNFVFVRYATTTYIFQDGVQVAAKGNTYAGGTTSNLCHIGADSTKSAGYGWNGLIDEVILENTFWNSKQVQTYYTNSLGRYAII